MCGRARARVCQVLILLFLFLLICELSPGHCQSVVFYHKGNRSLHLFCGMLMLGFVFVVHHVNDLIFYQNQVVSEERFLFHFISSPLEVGCLDRFRLRCANKRLKNNIYIFVNGIQLDQVEQYVYLGQRFTLIEINKVDNKIRMIKSGWQTFGRHGTIM